MNDDPDSYVREHDNSASDDGAQPGFSVDIGDQKGNKGGQSKRNKKDQVPEEPKDDTV